MHMIEDGKSKKFDLIVAKEVSRFSRDTVDSLLYTRKLLEYNVCVYFLSDNIVTASNDGELRLTIMSSMAQDEVRKISERTKFGFKRAIEKGTVLGNDNIWGYKKDNGKLKIDNQEAELIKEIFGIYANDSKIGLKKLSMKLQEKGYVNRNGNPIHQNTLKRIIQNPKYKGYYTGGLSTVIDYRSKKRNFYDPSQWKIYKDYDKVPPIIDEELWEKANQKLIERSKSAKMYQKYQMKYLLSGKLYCEKHQCRFVRKIRHYKNRPDEIYWYCSNFHKTGRKNCAIAYFKEKDLYNMLFVVFNSYEVHKERIKNELFSFYNNQVRFQGSINQEDRLQKEIHRLKMKKDKLVDLVLDGILSKNDFNLKKVNIEKQIKQIQFQLNELKIINSNRLIEVSNKQRLKKKTCAKGNQTQQQYNKKLEESILKELKITEENIESYIEELLDKIVVIEKPKIEQEWTSGKKKKQREKISNDLKIILVGDNVINYCITENL